VRDPATDGLAFLICTWKFVFFFFFGKHTWKFVADNKILKANLFRRGCLLTTCNYDYITSTGNIIPKEKKRRNSVGEILCRHGKRPPQRCRHLEDCEVVFLS